MARCRVDQSIERVVRDGFAFPLGVYPVEELTPKPGYTTAFESADGDDDSGITGGPGGGGKSGGTGGSGGSGKSRDADDDDDGPMPSGEWEEWPDRYVFDILVPATRIESLCRALFAILPGRVYPILDFLGQDEWREVDPYVSYELIGLDRFLEALRRFRGFFFEDGLVGFGAMSEEPFMYVFIDEHKVVTVRVQSDMKERVEGVLAAFDLEEVDELTSADSVTHEHRAVLDTPDDRRDLLNAEEIVEALRDDWRMVLNIDPESNVDEEGNDLGTTGWRCILRYDPPPPAAPPSSSKKSESTRKKKGEGRDDKDTPESGDSDPDAAPPADSPVPMELPEPRYAHIFLTADSLNRATELAVEGLEALLNREEKDAPDPDLPVSDPFLVQADRWGEADFIREVETVTGKKPDLNKMAVWFSEWLQ